MATETHAAEGAEQAAGMPQLDFATFPNQIFWLVVTLVVIYLILNKVALPRIASVLADRAGNQRNCLRNVGNGTRPLVDGFSRRDSTDAHGSGVRHKDAQDHVGQRGLPCPGGSH